MPSHIQHPHWSTNWLPMGMESSSPATSPDPQLCQTTPPLARPLAQGPTSCSDMLVEHWMPVSTGFRSTNCSASSGWAGCRYSALPGGRRSCIASQTHCVSSRIRTQSPWYRLLQGWGRVCGEGLQLATSWSPGAPPLRATPVSSGCGGRLLRDLSRC